MVASPISSDGRPELGKTPAKRGSAWKRHHSSGPAGEGDQHVRDHRIRRAPGMQAPPSARARAARVPRLRLGRDRAPGKRRASVYARRRKPPDPEGARRAERLAGNDRPWPYALGDTRRRHREERAPARCGGAREARHRPERHRRELSRAARAPHRARSRLHVGDGRGDRDASRGGALRRRPGRGRSRRLLRARGAFRLRGHPPRPSGDARRGAPSVPDGRRAGRRRGVRRVQRGRVPRRDARRSVPG